MYEKMANSEDDDEEADLELEEYLSRIDSENSKAELINICNKLNILQISIDSKTDELAAAEEELRKVSIFLV